MTLTKAQKWVAIAAGGVTILGLVLGGLIKLVDWRVASVSPTGALTTEVRAHESLPGHPGDHERLIQMGDDLSYLRGRFDSVFPPQGKKTP